MFFERLISTLHAPHSQLAVLDDALPLDIDRLRALFLARVRSRAEAGLLDEGTVAWLFRLLAEGWLDEHLQLVRDALLELGAVNEIERLLDAAVQRMIGETPRGLSHADLQLLLAAEQSAQGGGEGAGPLGLRLLSRRYALALGLIESITREGQEGAAGGQGPKSLRRTPLGDAALSLPRQQLLSFLLALEAAQSTGATGVVDRFCTPRKVLRAMFERRRFLVPTSAAARRLHDPEGLFPWRSIRRLHLLGVIEPVVNTDDGALGAGPDEPREVYLYRLTHAGSQALSEALREPQGDLPQLVAALVQERCDRALRPLLLRTQARLTPIAVEALKPDPALLRATELPNDLFRHAAQHVELPPGALELATRRPITGEIPPPRSADPGPELPVPEPIEDMPRILRLVPSSGPETAPQELDLGKLIQRAWDELQVQRVRFTLHGPGARALADRRALLQGWRELLRATADAALQAPHGAAQVAIEVTAHEDTVVALVHDNGPPLAGAGLGASQLIGPRTLRVDLDDSDVDFSALAAEPVDLGPTLDEAAAKSEPPGLPSWLASGARSSLWRAQRALLEQGALLTLLPPRIGGVSLRVSLPRTPRPARTAA